MFLDNSKWLSNKGKPLSLYNDSMHQGKFITIEGIDGCGKTTVTALLVQRLIQEGYDVVHTREPGGIDIAEQIRNVILDPSNTAMDPRTEALLYAASRRQHLVEKVIPALNAGKLVVCERFLDSSLAYQGIARGIGIDPILKINDFAIESHMPDITLLLNVDVNTAMERMKDRQGKDRLDQESMAFHHLVHDAFDQIASMYPNRIVKVDATQSIDTVVETMLSKLNEVLHG